MSKLQTSFDSPMPEEDVSYAELPQSDDIFMKELNMQTDRLRKCKDMKDCKRLLVFVEVLQSHIDTLSGKREELGYLRGHYGSGAYEFVMENKELIKLKTDEDFTRELYPFTNGKILNEENGFTKQEVSEIYRKYAETVGFEKLEKQRKNATTSRDKAVASFMEYLLFSDSRLYSLN